MIDVDADVDALDDDDDDDVGGGDDDCDKWLNDNVDVHAC